MRRFKAKYINNFIITDAHICEICGNVFCSSNTLCTHISKFHTKNTAYIRSLSKSGQYSLCNERCFCKFI
jgi:hypothetical protein